ncbi:MAG: IPT/TIG domain-containing protein [Gemmatimonadota bacterium]
MKTLRAGLIALSGALYISGCGGGPMQPPPPGGGANTIAVSGGNNQVAAPGASLPSLVALVSTSTGNPANGVSVTWTITSGAGASLSAASSTTGPDGTTSVDLTLGSAAGAYTVQAAITGATATFLATAETPVPTSIQAASGDMQSGMVGMQLASPFLVTVVDQFGNDLAGATVDFAITRGSAGSPSVSAMSASTDAQGQASTLLTLGDKNGTYEVTATAGSVSVPFSATASGGAEDLFGVTGITPDTMTQGGSATISGTGFSSMPANNTVLVDGVAAVVNTASDTQLTITLPDLLGLCLPRRAASVQVIVGPDNQTVNQQIKPASELSLTPGEHVLLSGPAAVGCVYLPDHLASEAEYEVIASVEPDGFVFTGVNLEANGRLPLTSIQRPVTVTAAQQQRTASGIAGRLPPELAARAVQHQWDLKMREMEAPLRPFMKAQPSFGLFSQVPPTVGDSLDFGVSCIPGPPPDVRAVAVSVGTAAAVFEDTVGGGGYFSSFQYDSIAAEFDTLTFATNEAYFGTAGDIDVNERIIILFTPAVNALTPGSYAQGFVAGFFCPLDLVPGQGNFKEMFYVVVPDTAGVYNGGGGTLDAGTVRTFASNTIGHEFQHLINAQVGNGGAFEVWLNEGLSHLAEEVNGHAALGLSPGSNLDAAAIGGITPEFITWYVGNFLNLSLHLQAPSDTAALLQTMDPGATDPNGTFRMRGAAWSFVRYLLDRFATPATEADFTRSIIQGSGNNRTNIEALTGSSFSDLVAEWSAMLAAEGRTDIASFGPELTLTSWDMFDMYDQFSLTVDPNTGTFGFGYGLSPALSALSAGGSWAGNLFTGTAQYARLTGGSDSGGTGIRFESDTGADLAASANPRLVVVRTQ